MHDDYVIYSHPAFKGQYVAAFGSAWWRWPAKAHGWTERHQLPHEPNQDIMEELPPRLGRLALLLSGVE